MKKLMVVLLSLGLIVAFGATASAATVKFGGSYYLVGVYDNNSALMEASPSRAYFYQRVRLEPVFQIAPGLSFTARMDAMEKQWGNTNWRRGVAAPGDDTTSSRSSLGDANAKVQESLEFERGYVTFDTGLGKFDVGYQSAATWGTVFADNGTTKPRIKFTTKFGNLQMMAIYEKGFEGDASAIPAYAAKKVDGDNDNYYLNGIYSFKGGVAGLVYIYQAGNSTTVSNTYKSAINVLGPFMKATFGPVYVEAEVVYSFGKARAYQGAGTDITKNGLSAYLMAKTKLGPATVGAQIGWSRGDDNAADDKDEAGAGGGTDWNPALILMNDELATWSNGGTNTNNSGKGNTLIYNLFAEYKVTPKLELGFALTGAKQDKKFPVTNVSDNYGLELDVTATYKLYDNLSYMVGAGYLWTGDYFKGAVATTKIDNDYILMNKLSLSF